MPTCHARRRVASLIPLLATLAASASGQSASVSLLRDVNALALPNPSANVSRLVPMGGFFYFAATSGNRGYELHRTNGTPGHVERVADIRPGPDSSTPTSLTVFGGVLYFAADDGVSGIELWRSDGSASGTRMVVDLAPGSASASPSHLLVLNGKLLFNATTPGVGAELFATDGTAAGTQLVRDIQPGAIGSQPFAPTAVPGTNLAVFSADANGREAWVTDGTTAGTQLLLDAFPGTGSGNPTTLTPFGNRLAFTAQVDASNNALFLTDGVTTTRVFTWPMTRTLPILLPAGVLGVNGTTLYLSADPNGSGRQLWRSDGTTAGTTRVTDLNVAGGSDPAGFATLGTSIVFSARVNPFQRNLYATDGTPGSTRLLQAIDLTAGPPIDPIVVGNQVYFGLSANGLGTELWATDGTPGGTRLILDIEPGAEASTPFGFVPHGVGLLFAAATRSTGREIWTTDLTTAGTRLLVDVDPAPLGTGDSNASEFTDRFGVSYFQANDGVSGAELWRTDGTTAGTFRLVDILPGPSTGSPTRMALVGDLLFFSAWQNLDDGQVWRTDGTLPGTFAVTSFTQSSPQQAVAFGGRAFFATGNGGTFEIHSSDGTVAGTRRLIAFPGRSFTDAYLTPLADRLLFVGHDAAQGNDLWVTDGTTAGTRRVTATATTGQPARFLTALDHVVLFVSGNPLGSGARLWLSDGTAAGTQPLPGISDPVNLTRAGDLVYFAATSGAQSGLFCSDGSVAGTRFVAAVSFSPFLPPTALGDRLLFAGTDPATGVEPWISDGTPAGTRMIFDVRPGPGDGLRSVPFAAGSRFAWFAGDDGVRGAELWRTDGVTATLVQDVLPGDLGGLPPYYAVQFGLHRGSLLVTCNDGTTGLEPHLLRLGATSKRFGNPCGPRAPTLSGTDPVLGGTLTITAARAPVGKIGLIKLGLPAAAPIQLAGCWTYIDPLQFTLDFAIQFVAQPRWQTSLPIPANPDLADLRLAFQAYYLNATGNLDFELSNGVEAVLGR